MLFIGAAALALAGCAPSYVSTPTDRHVAFATEYANHRFYGDVNNLRGVAKAKHDRLIACVATADEWNTFAGDTIPPPYIGRLWNRCLRDVGVRVVN